MFPAIRKPLLAIACLAMLALPSLVDAQIFRGRQFGCPPAGCQPAQAQVVIYSSAVPTIDAAAPVETSVGPSSAAAVKVLAGSGCGSGSIVGYWKTGSLVLTNAHVAGTRPGSHATVDLVVNGKQRRLNATVLMAAYSSKTLADWSVLYVPDFREITPVKLSKERPTGLHYTTGSPKCVWPLVSSTLTTADIQDNSPLWRWRPNSIGGQSGSGVWSKNNNLQYGLLTWSWGGLGAGQQTMQIYKQATERTTAGPPRIPGLQEVINRDVIVEEGFFIEQDIDTLPIWAGDTEPEEPGPTDPQNPCDLTPADLELVKQLITTIDARGLDHAEAIRHLIAMLNSTRPDVESEPADPVAREFKSLRDRYSDRGYDWVAIIKLLLQLIEIFGKAK